MSFVTSTPGRASRVSVFSLQLLVVVWCVGPAPVMGLDGSTFARLLTDLANNDLGVDQFQDYLDGVNYVDSTLDGEALVQNMANSLKAKFSSRIAVVQSLKETIEDEFAAFSRTNSFSECCYGSLNEEDFRFKTEVNLNEVCTSGEQLASATKLVTSAVRDKMKDNLRTHPTIRWQYFGSEEGVMTVYPSFRQCDVDYDPRFRPFYVSTATPQPKDVVIVVDTSGSMSGDVGNTNRMTVAIRAANTVINTLSPNDRVGVVAFQSEPSTPSGNTETSTCYATMLAKATPLNKEYLASYVSNLRPLGGTEYSKAFRRAFELIDSSEDDRFDTRTRNRVILFLTDGKPNDDQDDILATIRVENAKLGNEVVIHTYGIGEALDGDAEQTLLSIAQQHDYDHTVGEITEGKFTPVPDANDLRRIMGSYYNFFSKTGDIPDVNFVVPYFDAFGLGLVTSACLPVFYQSTLVGVTCVDITMSDLLSDVTYFQEGELSYAFMIDGQARLLMHPLLPQPYTVEEDPIYVNMPSLETFGEAEVDEVMQSMLRGEVNQKQVSSLRVISRGDAVYEGVQTTNVQSTYFWHPVDGTDFSICLVIAQQDRQASLQWDRSYVDNFVYHRLDLKRPASSEVCNYYGRLAVADLSSVQFAPASFKDPYEYLSREETESTVNEYAVYMTGQSDNNPGFKEGIRETVAMTAYFDQLLNSLGRSEYVVWRYIGTTDGVFRVTPGSSLMKDYDHTSRPWYQRSVSQKGTLTMSTPYIDGLGAGYVVTLSETLYEGSADSNHSPNDLVVGVMAMDFSLSYVYFLLAENFPECKQEPNSCFIIERGGFVVVHKDFVENDTPEIPQLENVHITVKEPTIALDLIRQNVMTKKACVNFESLRNQYFWSISLTSGNKMIEPDYEIHEVENTNVFLVVKKFSGFRRSYCNCPAGSLSGQSGLGTCLGIECECPCSTKTNIYEYCKDDFDLTDDSWPPCTPRLPDIDLDSVSVQERTQASKLGQCFNQACSSKTDEYVCKNSASCSWCSFKTKGDRISKPYCASYDTCPYGVLDNNGGGGDGGNGDGGNGDGGNGDGGNKNGTGGGGGGGGVSPIGPAVGGILVAVTIGVLAFILYKKRFASSPSSSPPPAASGSAAARGYDNHAMQPASPTAPSAPPPNNFSHPQEHPPSYESLHPPAYGHAGHYDGHAGSYDNDAFGGGPY